MALESIIKDTTTLLCFSCGIPGHRSTECNNPNALSKDEQAYLKNIIFGKNGEGSAGIPRPNLGTKNPPTAGNTAQSSSFPPIGTTVQQLGIVVGESKQPISRRAMIEDEDSWTPSYDAVITDDDDSEELELGVSSVKLDVCEDPPEVKELLKVLNTRRAKRTRTTVDEVEEPQMDNSVNRPS